MISTNVKQEIKRVKLLWTNKLDATHILLFACLIVIYRQLYVYELSCETYLWW